MSEFDPNQPGQPGQPSQTPLQKIMALLNPQKIQEILGDKARYVAGGGLFLAGSLTGYVAGHHGGEAPPALSAPVEPVPAPPPPAAEEAPKPKKTAKKKPAKKESKKKDKSSKKDKKKKKKSSDD